MNCISQTRTSLHEIIKHQPNALLFPSLMSNNATTMNSLLKATLLADFSHFREPSAPWQKWLLPSPPWVYRAVVSVCLVETLSQQQLLMARDSHGSVGKENCFQWVSTVSNQPRLLQTSERRGDLPCLCYHRCWGLARFGDWNYLINCRTTL